MPPKRKRKTPAAPAAPAARPRRSAAARRPPPTTGGPPPAAPPAVAEPEAPPQPAAATASPEPAAIGGSPAGLPDGVTATSPEASVGAAPDGDPANNDDPYDDPYHLLGMNTPPPVGRQVRKVSNAVFKMGGAMRLLAGHEGLHAGCTHKCTVKIDPTECVEGSVMGSVICGKLLRLGYNNIQSRWVSTRYTEHCSRYHPKHRTGADCLKREQDRNDEKLCAMFEAGRANQVPDVKIEPGVPPLKVSPKKPGSKQSFVKDHYQLAPDIQDLTSAARFYVYGRQRISKSTFDDSYFREAMQGSNKSRPLLTSRMLETYVRAEFAIFVLFLKFLVNKKLIQSLGNPFSQALHDGVTLGNHKGYESLGIDVVDDDWDRNLPICIGFRQKKMRQDGSYDGTDLAVGALFDECLTERTGHSLNTIVAAMMSDRAATGVARKLGFDGDGCLMHDADKLPQSGVGTLVRADMTQPVGANGHRPLANPFPEGVRLMKKFTKLGHYYAYGSRHNCLMKLRATSSLDKCSADIRIKVGSPVSSPCQMHFPNSCFVSFLPMLIYRADAQKQD